VVSSSVFLRLRLTVAICLGFPRFPASKRPLLLVPKVTVVLLQAYWRSAVDGSAMAIVNRRSSGGPCFAAYRVLSGSEARVDGAGKLTAMDVSPLLLRTPAAG
jgi:hypothetical protein